MIIAGLSALVLRDGAFLLDLQAATPIRAKELYRKISHSQLKLQLIDARPSPGEAYEDVHIPGSIPFPDCNPAGVDEKTLSRIFNYAPTVVISADGSREVFEKCRMQFKNAWNLAGGMTAWIDESLPEDSGEYVPPKASAGGGCL